MFFLSFLESASNTLGIQKTWEVAKYFGNLQNILGICKIFWEIAKYVGNLRRIADVPKFGRESANNTLGIQKTWEVAKYFGNLQKYMGSRKIFWEFAKIFWELAKYVLAPPTICWPPQCENLHRLARLLTGDNLVTNWLYNLNFG